MNNKNNMNTTDNSNIDKSMDDLLSTSFDSMQPWELDDATLNSYLASSGVTTGSKVRRAAKRFTATAACLAIILAGGLLIKDKLADSNNSNSNSTAATNTENKEGSISTDKNNANNDSANGDSNIQNPDNSNDIIINPEYPYVYDEYQTNKETAWTQFMNGKIKLIVMENVVTELGIVGFQCIVAQDCDIANQGQRVIVNFNDAIEQLDATVPSFLTPSGNDDTQSVKPGDIIAVEMPEAVDTALPLPLYINPESDPVYLLANSTGYITLSDLLYAPTTPEHLPNSTLGLTGVNSYVNEGQLDKFLEIVNSEEGTPYAITIASKDYTLLSEYYTYNMMNTDEAALYNLCKLMADNNYGITTYYDILYTGSTFVVRIDETEYNIIPSFNYTHTPYVMNFHNLHVVEDYKGTGSKCIYLCNDETPMDAETLVEFLNRYNDPADSTNAKEDYFVVMQSHLGVEGLRGGDNSVNNEETDNDKPINVYMDWEAGLEYADNTNREIKENHLKEDANMDRIISVEEAIKTAEKLQGAAILHKDTRQVVFYDITLGYAYDIGDDYIKRNWNSKIVYKIKAACVGEGVFYETSFYVNAIKSEVIDNDKEDNSELGVTLPPDHSEYRSENELIKAINAGKREELKNLFHYYMPQSLPDNWYIDKILVTPELIKITYKYAKNNEVKNVGDYSFTWYLEQKTDQDESTYRIIAREDGLKDVTWYKDGYYFSATVPIDAGMDEIRGFATLRTEVIK